MELFESLELTLKIFVQIGKFLLESVSVGCVLIGFFRSIQLAFSLNRIYPPDKFPFNQVRLKFGMWLALALEFQLGADILATTVTPSLESLGRLALIAVIRTFLNYFLSKEIETEIKLEKEEQKQLNC
jgi:uncharacterized membrane protein